MRRTGSKTGRLALAIAIPVLAFLSLASWAFASPVGASPDDDFHLASIWCGLGERPGLCEDPGDGSEARRIPTAVVSATCYVFKPEASADCWNPGVAGLSRVARANVDGLYPPVFYATMSVFASDDIPTSVLAMRLFNSAFAVGLLTAVFFALPRWTRPALVLSVLATCMPLGLFILASVNPSSWAILSGAVVWIAMYGVTQTSGRRRVVLAALTVFGALIGAGARADAAVYAVFAVGLALILGLRARRDALIPGLIAVGVVVLSALFYLSASQSGAVLSGLTDENPPLTSGQVIANALGVPTLWFGALGGWALGWLDTGMPATVNVLAVLVFCGALFVGVRRVHLRRGIAVALTVIALWAVPFVLLYQSHALVGAQVQPRYILPLMVIAVGVASLRRDAESSWNGGRLIFGGAALAVAFTIALHTDIQRYTTGTDELHLDPGGADAEWWWGAGPSSLVVWVGGSLAFAGIFVLLALLLPRQEREPSPAALLVPAVDAETPAATGSLEPGSREPVDATSAAVPTSSTHS
ncbi:DUF2142 domain-containing protein [Microbacterium sp. AZCO]|uniref:DUF2142 domain-containing protein n=1 Tax=Microbacterium sp. AZCO TaxID=3142976 RepID=UPI0031F4001A